MAVFLTKLLRVRLQKPDTGPSCRQNGQSKAAEICSHAAYSSFDGMAACPPPSDWQRVVEQKDELVAALREEKYMKVLEAYPNVSLIRGRAQLTGGRSVLVN